MKPIKCLVINIIEMNDNMLKAYKSIFILSGKIIICDYRESYVFLWIKLTEDWVIEAFLLPNQNNNNNNNANRKKSTIIVNCVYIYVYRVYSNTRMRLFDDYIPIKLNEQKKISKTMKAVK